MPDMTHYFQQFSANVRDLAGSPKRAILRELVAHENKTGSVVYLDSAGAGDDLSIQDLKTDKKTRKTYEAEESKTLAKFNAIFTPHDDITRQRTLANPKLIEWGHSFDEDEDILEIVDPQNKTVRQGMRSIWKQQDQQIINGIKAASVVRVDGDTSEVTPETVNFPGGQAFDTAQDDYMGRKDISRLVQLFEDQYVTDPIYCLISPTAKRGLIDNDDKITDSDFLAHGAAFSEEGKFAPNKFPDIYGVHFIVHPLVPVLKFYAWTKESVVLNMFKGFKSSMDVSPEQRFSYIAYMREKADCKRCDDLQVVHGTITESGV